MTKQHIDLHKIFQRGFTQQSPIGASLASVALIITPHKDLLFIRRSEHPKDPWSGHISFPGGREEPYDKTSIDCAIRETQEEVHLTLNPLWHTGRLDEVRTSPRLPPLVIRPHVFLVPKDLEPKCSDEVHQVFFVSLQDLLNNRNRTQMNYEWHDQTFKLPCVELHHGRLWGISLRIVDDLLNRIDGQGIGLARLASTI